MFPERADSERHQRIIPGSKRELRRKVTQPIHDGGRAQKKDAPASQRQGEVVIAVRARISEVMALINDDEREIGPSQEAGGEIPAAQPFVGPELHRHAHPAGSSFPLGQNGGRRDYQGRSRTGAHGCDRKRNPGLPAANRVGQEGTTIACQDGNQAEYGPSLFRPKPNRRLPEIHRPSEFPRDPAHDFLRTT